MGFGSTAKKLQRVTDLAEEVYERLSTLHDQVASLRDTVEDTNERVIALEEAVATNRAILDELAREQGLDPSAIEKAREGMADDPESERSSEPAASSE